MPAFYYVANGGTADGGDGGRTTTQRTGTFSSTNSENYSTIEQAILATTPPVAGDWILCDNADTLIYSPSQAVTYNLPDGVIVASVDNANQENIQAGYIVDNSSGAPGGNVNFTPIADSWGGWKGIHWKTHDDIVCAASVDGYSLFFEECTFEGTDTIHFLLGGTGTDGQLVIMKKCTLKETATTPDGHISLIGTRLILDQLAADAAHVKWTTQLIRFGFGVGWSEAIIRNTDIDSLIASSALFADILANNNSSTLKLHRCKVNASQTYDAPVQGNDFIEAHSIDAGDSYFAMHEQNLWGSVEHDTTTYRNATYDGTNGISLTVDTTAEASLATPYRVKLMDIPAEDLTTARTVTVNFTSADSGLTISDVAIEAVRGHTTIEAQGVIASTMGVRIPPTADTGHTTGGTGWTSGLGTNYIETLNIGALTDPDNSVVEVWALITKPSITVNFDLPEMSDT